MNTRITKDLEKAKALYKDLRLAEAYPLFKRLYDRLPFNYIPEHSEYFGMFVRTLYELGRESELKFYANEFEKLYEKTQDLQIGYQIAYIYSDDKSVNTKFAQQTFERIIKESQNEDLKIKSKMCLASLCQSHLNNSDLLKTLIYSIQAPKKPDLYYIWMSWKGIVLRNEKKIPEAEILLTDLLAEINPKEHWYPHFTSKVILAGVYVEGGKNEKASGILCELKENVKNNPLKSLIRQIEFLESKISKNSSSGSITVREHENFQEIICGTRSYKNRNKTSSEKLLSELIKNKTMDKNRIVKTLYDRKYSGENDDKLIYYHVFCVRALLGKIGIPASSIENVNGSYQLSSEVTYAKGTEDYETEI